MSMCVSGGATLTCSFGTAASTLMVTADKKVTSTMPLATIMDNVLTKNIMPFGMCTSLNNPTVASATSAAMGTLTPMPCTPIFLAPWAPGSSSVLIGNIPALNKDSKLACMYSGVVQITNPAITNIQVP